METPAVLEDRYRFESPLGAGSQGTTVRATRLADEQTVAIKSLNLANVSDWKAVELFEREADTLSNLDLPGVPKVHEYISEEAADGQRFYLVLDLIEGESALAMMKGGYRFDEEEVINMAWQILGILERLHAVRPPVVHRDIKPSNIIVQPSGELALVDFGAVTAQPTAEDEEGGTVAGTFGYMAPEQFQGRAVPASDVYGVGATMVHLLSGKPPSAMDTELFRLDFRPHVQASEPLLDLLDRMLAPEVAHRIETAADARQALEYLELGGPPGDDDDDGALVPVGKVGDLEVAGQPGTMAIFHSLPAAPRKMPSAYSRKILGKTALYIGGGGVAAALGVAGAFSFFGLGVVEMVCIAAFPLVLGWGLLSRSRKLKRLIRDGERAVGTVKRIGRSQRGFRVYYEFTARGKAYSGQTRLDNVDVYWEEGDEVGILFMTDKPEISVIYPLPPATVLNALAED